MISIARAQRQHGVTACNLLRHLYPRMPVPGKVLSAPSTTKRDIESESAGRQTYTNIKGKKRFYRQENRMTEEQHYNLVCIQVCLRYEIRDIFPVVDLRIHLNLEWSVSSFYARVKNALRTSSAADPTQRSQRVPRSVHIAHSNRVPLRPSLVRSRSRRC